MAIDVVVADDLTGASDTLVQFVPVSEATIVYPSLERFERAVANGQLGGAGRALALAVSTESRHLQPAAAGVRVARAHRAALRLSPRLLFQKVDSAMRGNPGAELDAYARAAGARRLLMTPAFPPSRRTVRNGMLLVDNLPIVQTSDGADPRTPLPFASIPRLLGAQTSLPVTALPAVPDTIAGLPDGIAVVDAQDDADLDRIARFVLAAGLEHAASGSAGLAGALARGLPSVARTATPYEFARRGGVLVVCGSPHATIAAQLTWLAERAAVPLRRIAATGADRSVRDATLGDLDRWGLALVCAPPLKGSGQPGRTEPAAVLARLAVLTSEIAAATEVGALVLSGGDTAAAVCDALGVDRVELIGQVFPGAPFGRIAGGLADGTALATKSGAHGEPDGLIRIVAVLRALIPRAKSTPV